MLSVGLGSLPVSRLRESPEVGPDGELRGSSQERGASEAQPPPGRALPGGEPMQRIPGVPAVCGGLSAPASGESTGSAHSLWTGRARVLIQIDNPVSWCLSAVPGREADQPLGEDSGLSGSGGGEEACPGAGGGVR